MAKQKPPAAESNEDAQEPKAAPAAAVKVQGGVKVKLIKAHRCVVPGVVEIVGKEGDVVTVPSNIAKHLIAQKVAEKAGNDSDE